jgi:tRNA(Ile2) C34 agmatinyltransferase TiaS
MNNKKPTPLVDAPLRAVCPVCGKTSYSRGGRHPQCGVARADAEFKALQRAAKADEPFERGH